MIDKNTVLTHMKQDMVLRGFSKSTQDNYHRYAQKYLEYSDGKTDEERIRNFLAHLLEDRKLMLGTVNMYNAAIRFLLEITLDIAVNHRRIPRLREHHGLPEILKKEELRRIFEHTIPERNRARNRFLYHETSVGTRGHEVHHSVFGRYEVLYIAEKSIGFSSEKAWQKSKSRYCSWLSYRIFSCSME